MRIAQTYSELRLALTQSAQAPEALDPWPAWKTFKAFLRREVEDGYDAAAIQFDIFPDDSLDGHEANLFLVRQFSEREGPPGAEQDELIGRVVVELAYPPAPFQHFTRTAIWTHDFPTLEEWASVVEAHPAFQTAMARSPARSAVYYDEGAEEYPDD